MQRGEVDLVIVGADRITRNGDVANKTGTYLKALAAFDNGIPFYVAAPETTFDYELETGSQVPIEERHGNELQVETPDVAVRNPAFDITPARLITGYLTDKQTS
jgi:methylthioribose-1-phosphate isomerase